MWFKVFKNLFILSPLLFGACAYRFTNKHISIPSGAKTIAISPIYDSSRVVLPHDALWSALQLAFGSSGHLVVTKTSQADYVLAVHLKDARSSEYETDSRGTLQNPHDHLNSNGQPFAPNQYVNLHSADVFSKRELLNFSVGIEIWDVRTRTLLLQKDYPIQSNFNIFSTQSTPESQFLRTEENLELLFVSQSKALAQRVVSDFFASPIFESDPQS